MAATDLCTAVAVARLVGSTADDADVLRAVAAASSAVVAHLDRGPIHYAEEITERVAGTGRHRLVLQRKPLIDLTSVTLEDAEIEAEIEDADAGVLYAPACFPFTGALRPGIVQDQDGGTERKLLEVVYEGGWVVPGQVTGDLAQTLPFGIEEAALITAVSLFRNGGADRNVASESVGAASVSYFGTNTAIGRSGNAIPDAALALLAPYKRIPV